MKPVDRRKLFSALHRGCPARGLALEEDADAGAGSHGSLIFHGASDTDPLRLVLVYSREISPGVQRGMLRYVSQQVEVRASAGARGLAKAVLELLQECLR